MCAHAWRTSAEFLGCLPSARPRGLVHDANVSRPSSPDTGVSPWVSSHWLIELYDHLNAGDFDALRDYAVPDYRLRIPDLGVDVHGLDLVLAWLRTTTGGRRHRVAHVVEDGSFLVATVEVEVEPDGHGTPNAAPAEIERDCHVFTRSPAGLTSCCVVSA